MSSELELYETFHPNEVSINKFDNLIGIDSQKNTLLNTLNLLLNTKSIEVWKKKHHPRGLSFFDNYAKDPLIILSGEVGCGKTELANSIASPLAKKLDIIIKTYETPSNIRGSGRVGEISSRITEAFNIIKSKVVNDKLGILIIDEGDDLATSRSQNQAHHEDRAGLNVLIKQLDLLKKEKKKIVVILITNRENVLDPAFYRRATLHLKFERPNRENREKIFKHIFQNIKLNDSILKELLSSSEKNPPYTYSDLIQKIGTQALFKAIELNKPFSPEIYLDVLLKTEASPLIV